MFSHNGGIMFLKPVTRIVLVKMAENGERMIKSIIMKNKHAFATTMILLLLTSCKTTTTTGPTLLANTVDLATGLVAHYSLAGNGVDSSGGGFNGVNLGAAAATDRFGHPSSALRFNGSTSYVLCDNILNDVFCAPIAKFTVAGWARATVMGSFASGKGYIIGKNAGGNLGPYMWGVGHYDGLVYATIFSDTAANNFIGLTSPMGVNEWFHFAMVFDGSLPELERLKLYVDGTSYNATVFRHVGTLSTTTTPSQQHLTIGASHAANAPLAPANFFTGDIDDIRIYNRAFTQAEVQALYFQSN